MSQQYKTIIEIGSWKGRSTHALLSGALLSGGHVTAVDHFQGTESELNTFHKEAKYRSIYYEFMANVSKFPNLTVIKDSSKNAAEQITGEVEMVFLDGDHTGEAIAGDIERWLPKVSKLICGHDFQFSGVKKAVLDKFGFPNTAETIWYVNLSRD